MRIQGLGVIDDATLELDAGLTVLTGETGAGKTMVVTGLTLLGGGRAEASRVADGARRAVVEGRFTADAAALAVADEVGAEADDDGALIAVRTVGADGRSRAHLGGRAVPVGVLARLAESTLAVHGQNDQLRLLRPAEQRALLDRFAGDAVGVPLQRYRAVRAEWQAVAAELVERRDGARRLAQEADLLRHGLTEIEAVDPQPGEDRELTEEARRLAAADDLREAAGDRARRPRGGRRDGRRRRRLRSPSSARPATGSPRPATARSPRWTPSSATCWRSSTTSRASSPATWTGWTPTPSGSPHVLGRQAELKALTRKYAADIDGVLAWAQQARERLEHLDTSDEALAALAARRDALAAELAEHAAAVTAARTAAAERLADGTTAELGGLAMPDARLLVAVTPASGGPGRRRRADASATRPSRRARTASTRSSCGWSPTPAPRRSRCTRARRAVSCRA